MDNKNFGYIAEEYAAKFLRKSGYRIIKKNFRTSFSEIDIIAKKNDYLVFVEVKARSSLKFGFPEEAVSNLKLNRIKKAAYVYLQKYRLLNKKFRIDIVSLTYNKSKVISKKIIQVF